MTLALALSRVQLAVEPIACCENPWPNAWEVKSLVQRSSAGPRKSPQMERWRGLLSILRIWRWNALEDIDGYWHVGFTDVWTLDPDPPSNYTKSQEES